MAEKKSKYVHHTGYSHLSADPMDALAQMEVAAKAGITTMLWGSPGIGKTSICYQLGEKLEIPTVVLNPSQIDMIDIKFPYLEKKGTEKVSRFALSDLVPRERCLFVVDEINTALPATQPMWFSLTLEKRIGTHKLPEGSVVLATGNREFDRSAAQPMALAQKDRMMHINVVPSDDAFYEWGIKNGVREEILAFVRNFPDALESADPDDPSGGCTPRSLAALSTLLNTAHSKENKFSISEAAEARLIYGVIGQGQGVQFQGFLDIFRNKISFEDILNDPEGYKVPDKSDIKYCIAVGLAQRADKKNIKNVCKYVDRMEPTYSVVLMKDLAVRKNGLQNTPEFRELCKKHVDLVIPGVRR